MKAWYGYGSEHSMNLVMIGHFDEVRDASKVKKLLEELGQRVQAEYEHYEHDPLPEDRRFTPAMLEFLTRNKIHSIGPTELEQFVYDVHVSVDGSDIVITTDEIDVSAFLKVLVDYGARVEVYSAHDHPGTGHGR